MLYKSWKVRNISTVAAHVASNATRNERAPFSMAWSINGSLRVEKQMKTKCIWWRSTFSILYTIFVAGGMKHKEP
ncbi:hypothetical protein CPB83DRAFT_843666 [Crepidotus variabilis]|uniref:Uncharacterized protein n=1 Tax=Crepidotus variabilis TaxID=179855 RepID=A0A9P6ESB0_9AGAR|nr:hypothetical protein CPB83DRAFT_843666 [Crepidotus variabilis]